MHPKNTYKPRKKPQQKRSEITNDAILEAAAHILTEEGYSQLNTNYIAEKAGVSIGSLYQYYPNKEAIVATLIERSVNKDVQHIENLLKKIKAESLETTIHCLIHTAMDRCQQDLPIAIALREQIPRVEWTNKMREYITHLEQSVFDLLKTRYSNANEDKLYKTAFITVRTVDRLINETLFEHPDWLANTAFRNSVSNLITLFLHNELKNHN